MQGIKCHIALRPRFYALRKSKPSCLKLNKKMTPKTLELKNFKIEINFKFSANSKFG